MLWMAPWYSATDSSTGSTIDTRFQFLHQKCINPERPLVLYLWTISEMVCCQCLVGRCHPLPAGIPSRPDKGERYTREMPILLKRIRQLAIRALLCGARRASAVSRTAEVFRKSCRQEEKAG
jgi:hypothetical protein